MNDIEGLARRAVEAGKGKGHAPSIAALLADLCSIVAGLSVRVASVEEFIALAVEKNDYTDYDELEGVTVVCTGAIDADKPNTVCQDNVSTSELSVDTTIEKPQQDAQQIGMMMISEEVEVILAERDENVNKRFESLRRASESDKKKIRALFTKKEGSA